MARMWSPCCLWFGGCGGQCSIEQLFPPPFLHVCRVSVKRATGRIVVQQLRRLRRWLRRPRAAASYERRGCSRRSSWLPVVLLLCQLSRSSLWVLVTAGGCWRKSVAEE